MLTLPLSAFVTLTPIERAQIVAGALRAYEQPDACRVFGIAEEERAALVVRLKGMLGMG